MAVTIRVALFELVQRSFLCSFTWDTALPLYFILFFPFVPSWPLSPFCIALSLEVIVQIITQFHISSFPPALWNKENGEADFSPPVTAWWTVRLLPAGIVTLYCCQPSCRLIWKWPRCLRCESEFFLGNHSEGQEDCPKNRVRGR